MKKFLASLLIIVVIVVAVVVVMKDTILKTVVERAVTTVTGFNTHLDGLHYEYPSTIQITGLKIENPAEFKERTFVNIPEIYVSLILPEFLKEKRIHLPEVRLNIQEVHVEKNDQGVSNIEKLTAMQGKTAKAPAKTAPVKSNPMPFQLDKLVLTIRNVSYEDRSSVLAKGVSVPGAGTLAAPSVVPNKLAVDLNVQNEVFTNITKPEALVTLIVSKVLSSATLGRLLDIDPNALMKDSLSGALNGGKVLGTKAIAFTDEATRGTVDNASKILEGSVGDATKTVDAAAQKTKEQVSGLLGKLGSVIPGEEKKTQ